MVDVDTLTTAEWDGLAITEWLENREYEPWLTPSSTGRYAWAHDNPDAWEHAVLPEGMTRSEAQSLMTRHEPDRLTAGATAMVETVETFYPGQPRDWRGRWTSGGGIRTSTTEGVGTFTVEMGHALEGTNPYRWSAAGESNCQSCTAAYEMRRREYKVVARPGGPANRDTSFWDWWQDPEDGLTGSALRQARIRAVVKPVEDRGTDPRLGFKVHQFIADTYEPGQRGALVVATSPYTAHMMNWERTTDGAVIMDTQAERRLTAYDPIFRSCPRPSWTQVARLDDLGTTQAMNDDGTDFKTARMRGR